MRLLLTRPETDGALMRTALEAAGHGVVSEPLLRVELLPRPQIVPDGVQALIATSRNGLRALALCGDRERAVALPLVTVGAGTAALGREMGFARIVAGPAAARDLPAVILREFSPADGTLLHLAGETVAFDLAGALASLGFTVHVATVYRAVAATLLSRELQGEIAAGRIDGVILMSPRTAGTYADLIRRHGLEAAARRIVHLCLSSAVAEPLGGLAGRVVIAPRPNGEEMLALIDTVAAQSDKKVSLP